MVEERSRVTADEIGRVFRTLSNEHVDAVNDWANNQALWERLNQRSSLSAVPSPQQGVTFLPRFRTARAPRAALLVAALTGLSALGLGFVNASVLFPSDDDRELTPVSFVVTDGTQEIVQAPNGQLIASESEPVHIELSDKGRIDLEPHTTLRLKADLAEPSAGQPDSGQPNSGQPDSGQPNAARPNAGQAEPKAGRPRTKVPTQNVIARVAQGKINVRLAQERSTRYRFHAGPYIVRVVGTAFSLDYRPEGEQLHLDEVQGTIEVTSPSGLQKVRAGQSLRLSSDDSSMKTVDDDALGQNDREGTQPDPKSASSAPSAAKVVNPAHAHSSPANDGPTIADFSKLGAQGEFAKIVKIAQGVGISKTLSSASSVQLQELAQAARYTGHLALAEQTWKAMRGRFAGQNGAKNAGFFLGRLAEQRGQLSTALAHYETYLRESPRGVYAAEAWGRKLQVIQSTRGRESAKSVAQDYLRRYPQGPYAKTARELLD